MTRDVAPRTPPLLLGVAAALAVTSGVLYALALPPLRWWALGWLALAPVCVACAGQGARRGAGLGLLFGLTAACGTSPWLPAMIADYFEAAPLASWPLALLAWVLGGALYHLALGAWLGWATRHGRVSPWVVGAVFWLLEWARAHAPVPNPWALLAYSQVGWLPAAQIADCVGPYGLGALLAATSAAVADLVVSRRDGSAWRRDVAWLVATLVLVQGYGWARLVEPVATEGVAIRVGLVQGAIPVGHRYEAQHLDDSLAQHLMLTRRAVDAGAELVFWPELALDFYLEREPVRRARLVSALEELGVDLLAGGLGVAPSDGRAGPTNSVFLVTGNGTRGRYDKIRLMPFSEAGPISWLPLGSDRLVPGSDPKPILREDVAFGLAICSEAMYPDFVRETVRAGAEVIVAPTIDTWFGAPSGLLQQRDAVAMRAIETRRYVVRPTATGVTAVIDPHGRVVAEASIDEPAVVIAEIAPRTAWSPYVRFGDAGVGFALALVLIDTRRRTRTRDQEESA